MGEQGGNRYKSIHGESTAPSDLVVCFLREVDTANAYVTELQDAVAREDRWRCAAVRVALHDAWMNAQRALTRLEQLSGHREVHARELLQQSQVAARAALDGLWALVTKSNARSTR